MHLRMKSTIFLSLCGGVGQVVLNVTYVILDLSARQELDGDVSALVPRQAGVGPSVSLWVRLLDLCDQRNSSRSVRKLVTNGQLSGLLDELFS